MKWILDNHTPKEVPLDEWAEWYESADRRVAFAQLDTDLSVSTVFLGIDHNFADSGPPLLFETMIFGGEHDEYQARYSTWDDAEKGHKAAMRLAAGDTA